MEKRITKTSRNAVLYMATLALPAGASTLLFSTGDPDGKIATVSRPAGPGLIETETADDFVLKQTSSITHATFVGLLPAGQPLSDANEVEIELYHVFPADSANPPSGNVPTRVNSPSDVEFMAFDSANGGLSFTTTLLNQSFTVANTVVNGINKSPNQFTGGEGAATGEEVLFNIVFNTPFSLPSGTDIFFRPEVGLTDGNFLWLSAPKPIVGGTGPFLPDLQTWTRNSNLAPDWLRIGTDITHQGPFNATFSLSGDPIPEPSTLLLLGGGFLVLGVWRWKTSVRTLSKSIVVTISLCGLADGQEGVVESTKNAQQISLLHWYQADSAAQFAVGIRPTALTFDGQHIWVVNSLSNRVTELNASDGATLATIAAGLSPSGVASDGVDIWITDFGSNDVLKLRASDGAYLGTFPVGSTPTRLVFDGADLWVANSGSNNVTKMREVTGPTSALLPWGRGPLCWLSMGKHLGDQ